MENDDLKRHFVFFSSSHIVASCWYAHTKYARPAGAFHDMKHEVSHTDIEVKGTNVHKYSFQDAWFA